MYLKYHKIEISRTTPLLGRNFMQKFTSLASMITLFCLIISLWCMRPAYAADEPFIFGLLMAGSHQDQGRSQTIIEAGKYVEIKIPGTKMIFIDKVNPADRPGMTIPLLVDDMVEKGARLIIASAFDMQDGLREAALQHPDIYFIQISGDDVLTNKAPKNLSNLTGRLEYGQMMAGFAAALTTKTGKIGYLGSRIDQESLRLTSSAFLGARYGWEKVLNKDPKELKFQVIWIGWRLNLPEVTADPVKVANDFFNTGFDVVILGIDTNEVLTAAQQKHNEGKAVRAIGSNFIGACEASPDVCLGVPVSNWGPGLVQLIQSAMSAEWKSQWLVLSPDWKDMNNSDTRTLGFVAGSALSGPTKTALRTFFDDLGSGRLNMWKGPLNYQDGKPFLKAGEVADAGRLWFMEQLLEGMSGQSKTDKSE
jgi:simple sugar transport system substrate-binding protein